MSKRGAVRTLRKAARLVSRRSRSCCGAISEAYIDMPSHQLARRAFYMFEPRRHADFWWVDPYVGLNEWTDAQLRDQVARSLALLFAAEMVKDGSTL